MTDLQVVIRNDEDLTHWLKEFKTLSIEKKGLTACLDDTQKRMNAIQAACLEAMSERGMASVKFSEGGSVGIRKEVWGKLVGDDDVDTKHLKAREALEKEGYGDIAKVRVNAQTLRGLVGELVADGGALPESFAGVIEIDERYSLRSYR